MRSVWQGILPVMAYSCTSIYMVSARQEEKGRERVCQRESEGREVGGDSWQVIGGRGAAKEQEEEGGDGKEGGT
eukprot:3108850-Rhodomonas_salina.1